MMRQCVQITLLSGLLVGGGVPVALAQGRGPDVVATITAISQKTGNATLRTETGQVVRLPKSPGWQVGDKVICHRSVQQRSQLFDCRPWQ
jgi:hypothetical protein